MLFMKFKQQFSGAKQDKGMERYTAVSNESIYFALISQMAFLVYY